MPSGTSGRAPTVVWTANRVRRPVGTNDEECVERWRSRYLGNSGLKISEITYGNWLTHGSQVENDMAEKCVRAALDAGITTFDTADVYANGAAETVLGQALAGERREGLEIFTKVYFPVGERGPNDTGLSRKHISEGIDASVASAPTTSTSTRPTGTTTRRRSEETIQAFADVVRSGKALYIGVSEWTAEQLREGQRLAREAGFSIISTSRSTPRCGASSRRRWCRRRRSSASRRSCGRRSPRACSPGSTSRARHRRRVARHRRQGWRSDDQALPRRLGADRRREARTDRRRSRHHDGAARRRVGAGQRQRRRGPRRRLEDPSRSART